MRRLATLLLVPATALALLAPASAAAPAPAPPVAPHTQPGPARAIEHIRVPLDRHDPRLGHLHIGYRVVPRRDQDDPLAGTIVAVEGGPGYATTASLSYYRDLFGPMLGHRRLLVVDLRGTGTSEPIRCPQLQSYTGNYQVAVGRCGRQLGDTSDVYGTAIAARDLVAVLDHLGIGRIDLYGDSYGTFFSQAFAARHPERIRSLVLDGAYWVGGTDPWYSDTNRALRDAFRSSCRRSPPCANRPGGTMGRIARLATLLRRHVLTGRAPNADGVVRRVRVGVGTLVNLVTAAATTPTLYRELDAAARAVLRPHPYQLPLLRLAREIVYPGGAGRPRYYSEGLYAAVSCNDYPQPYDMTAPVALRRQQYAHSVRRLVRGTPRLFAPFSVREWVDSSYGYYADCLRWPAPSRWVHPVPREVSYPDVPTLVLAGDLDSLTSPEGARATAAAFPDSTFVEVANTTHVTALVDFGTCASVIVRRFVRTRDAGDTSCAANYHENRLVDRFVRTATATGWLGPRRRTARVADATAADVMARWLSMYHSHGVGLRGGTFTVHGGFFGADHPVVRWRLHGVRWVADVAVSGTMSWHRRYGRVSARLRVTGRGASAGRLRLHWRDTDRHAVATAAGRLGGRPTVWTFPAA